MSGSRRRATMFGATLALALGVAELAGVPAARAAAPVVIVFLPVTGVVGTSVTVTGIGFDDPSPATGVAFNGTAATSFTVDSDTQITATVPVGATTGPGGRGGHQATGGQGRSGWMPIPRPRRPPRGARRRGLSGSPAGREGEGG